MTDVLVTFEAELVVELEPPFDSDVVRQAVQDAIGFTGVIVGEILIADGASDL